MTNPCIQKAFVDEIRRVAINTQFPGGSINNAPGNCNIEPFLYELIALREREKRKKTKVMYAANI